MDELETLKLCTERFPKSQRRFEWGRSDGYSDVAPYAVYVPGHAICECETQAMAHLICEALNYFDAAKTSKDET